MEGSQRETLTLYKLPKIRRLKTSRPEDKKGLEISYGVQRETSSIERVLQQEKRREYGREKSRHSKRQSRKSLLNS